jgi:2-polyprenyl-3-methyl-5-hydroxy-6-metoxy-1,4-benzoquinol methylase
LNLAQVEREKYEQIWGHEEYQKSESEGERYVDAFFEICGPIARARVIDIGCGAGGAGLMMAERGLQVHWLDLTSLALRPEVPRLRFLETPLWANWHRHPGWDFGYCAEVMEHIPTEYVMLVAANILRNCKTAFFTICNRNDNFGPGLLGQPLHLTVRPYKWWLEAFEQIGKVKDARDLCGQSLFVVGG